MRLSELPPGTVFRFPVPSDRGAPKLSTAQTVAMMGLCKVVEQHPGFGITTVTRDNGTGTFFLGATDVVIVGRED